MKDRNGCKKLTKLPLTWIKIRYRIGKTCALALRSQDHLPVRFKPYAGACFPIITKNKIRGKIQLPYNWKQSPGQDLLVCSRGGIFPLARSRGSLFSLVEIGDEGLIENIRTRLPSALLSAEPYPLDEILYSSSLATLIGNSSGNRLRFFTRTIVIWFIGCKTSWLFPTRYLLILPSDGTLTPKRTKKHQTHMSNRTISMIHKENKGALLFFRIP